VDNVCVDPAPEVPSPSIGSEPMVCTEPQILIDGVCADPIAGSSTIVEQTP
jgi:hypothetical protein